MTKNISVDKLKKLYQEDVQEINKNKLLDKITNNTNFSISFIVLLIGSSVVCTLGLLMNTPAVVIGGMIISPLMWPLMKISIGVSYAKRNYVKQALILLFISIAISLLSAFLITLISPLKLINAEIISRTNPTLLDIFVAISAGAVAALAMAQTRISESLAGVAVATSLMPPLCVSGIGLALFNISVFAGGFLLFITNVISIVFISIFTFIFLGIKSNRKNQFRTESIIFISGAMILTAIPLFVFLKNFSFRSTTYQKVENVLSQEFKEISPKIHLQNIQTTVSTVDNQETVKVNAEILIPEELSLEYEQRQSIIKELENNLRRKIDLNLLIQKTISLQSEEDKKLNRIKQMISETFKKEIEKINTSFTIDSIQISQNNIEEELEKSKNEQKEKENSEDKDIKRSNWIVTTVLRGDSSIQFTESQRQEIENQLRSIVKEDLELDIEIISRLQLKSAPDLETEKIKQDVNGFFSNISESIDISAINVQTEEKTINITVTLIIPEKTQISENYIEQLHDLLKENYSKDFKLQVNFIEKNMMLYN